MNSAMEYQDAIETTSEIVSSTYLDPIPLMLKDTAVSNVKLFIMMLLSQRQGKTCLPFLLGLDESAFDQLVLYISQSDLDVSEQDISELAAEGKPSNDEDLRQTLLELRKDECDELRALLVENRAGNDASELWMADVVVAGCLGSEHLWRDLGLSQRSLLSELMLKNFPALAENNNQDMKWKKYLYKQLCEKGGGYVCRSPSCEACKAYDECFGPEV